MPPALMPFTFHWYAGDGPPLACNAVKETSVPAHTVEAVELIMTKTGRFGLTVMVMAFDEAGFPVAQVSPDKSVHVTTSLFNGTYENIVLFDPEIIPFTFH